MAADASPESVLSVWQWQWGHLLGKVAVNFASNACKYSIHSKYHTLK